jgi:outer membrane protein assembly factor BamD
MKIFLSIIVLFQLISCASEKPTGKTEAEILYKEAKSLVEDERYLLATEKLNQLKNQYPYSYYATPAELMQADIFYLQENFVEAAASYLLFRDFHPKHAKLSYVVYRIAESYYQQLPDTDDRDLEAAHEAIKYYNELVVRFRDSKFTKKAQDKIDKCQGRIRSYEQYVADFYFKTEKYSAAKWRYNNILENFKQKELRSHSMQRMILASFHLKEYRRCVNLSEKYTHDLLNPDKKIVNEYTRYCKKQLN